ncbi:hypothetical protein PGQ11_002608 [Apiospora arundinis]|uniref:Antitoxin n=1 Tax=Apiospora arundinis TaxID=335852 RepID=A0ABR2JIN2_9PEZI
MSKIVNDIKSGIKGVQGAGDAIRGSAMEVTDQAFDNRGNHAETQLSANKNRGITEKGKQDIAGVDHMVARHEQKHGKHTAAAPAAAPTTTTTGTTMGTGVGAAETGTGTAGGVNSRVV